jgi:hypothetical protein
LYGSINVAAADNPRTFFDCFLGAGVACMGNLALYFVAVFSLSALVRFVPAMEHAGLATTFPIIVLADCLVIWFLRRREESVLIGLIIATAMTVFLSAVALVFYSNQIELPY